MNLLLQPVAVPDKNKFDAVYEVVEDYEITYKNYIIWIPKFFQYDGASIPRLLWPVIGSPFNPKYMKAAAVHDWLYHTHQVDRGTADEIFYKILLANKVGPNTAQSMYDGVRMFCSWYWENDKEDEEYIDRLKYLISEDGRNIEKYGL